MRSLSGLGATFGPGNAAGSAERALAAGNVERATIAFAAIELAGLLRAQRAGALAVSNVLSDSKYVITYKNRFDDGARVLDVGGYSLTKPEWDQLWHQAKMRGSGPAAKPPIVMPRRGDVDSLRGPLASNLGALWEIGSILGRSQDPAKRDAAKAMVGFLNTINSALLGFGDLGDLALAKDRLGYRDGSMFTSGLLDTMDTVLIGSHPQIASLLGNLDSGFTQEFERREGTRTAPAPPPADNYVMRRDPEPASPADDGGFSWASLFQFTPKTSPHDPGPVRRPQPKATTVRASMPASGGRGAPAPAPAPARPTSGGRVVPTRSTRSARPGSTGGRVVPTRVVGHAPPPRRSPGGGALDTRARDEALYRMAQRQRGMSTGAAVGITLAVVAGLGVVVVLARG
jgi:hypothetical protein